MEMLEEQQQNAEQNTDDFITPKKATRRKKQSLSRTSPPTNKRDKYSSNYLKNKDFTHSLQLYRVQIIDKEGFYAIPKQLETESDRLKQIRSNHISDLYVGTDTTTQIRVNDIVKGVIVFQSVGANKGKPLLVWCFPNEKFIVPAYGDHSVYRWKFKTPSDTSDAPPGFTKKLYSQTPLKTQEPSITHQPTFLVRPSPTVQSNFPEIPRTPPQTTPQTKLIQQELNSQLFFSSLFDDAPSLSVSSPPQLSKWANNIWKKDASPFKPTREAHEAPKAHEGSPESSSIEDEEEEDEREYYHQAWISGISGLFQ